MPHSIFTVSRYCPFKVQKYDTVFFVDTRVVDTVGDFAVDIVDTGSQFATGIMISVLHLELQICWRILNKNSYVAIGMTKNPGEDDS